MTSPKTFVQTIDLDDLERQLREAASFLPSNPSTPSPSLSTKTSDDALAELAVIVGRNKQPRGVRGGRNRAVPTTPAQASVPDGSSGDLQSGEPTADPGRVDLETSVSGAELPRGLSDPPPVQTERQHALPPHSEPPSDQLEDAIARCAGVVASARLDGVEHVPIVPRAARRASTEPSFASRYARSLVAPLLLVAIATGTAVMFAGPDREGLTTDAGDTPVQVQPGAVAGGDQTPSQLAVGAAGSPDKPNSPAELAGQPAESVAASLRPASPSPASPSNEASAASTGETPMLKADDAAVMVPPAQAAGDDQTASQSAIAATGSGKPDQPAELVATPSDGEIARAPATPGIGIVSGSASADMPAPAPPPGVPAPAPVAGATPSPVAAVSVPLTPAATASVPLPNPPQPAAPLSTNKTPHRVAAMPVTAHAKPPAIIGSGQSRAATRTKPLAARANLDAGNVGRNDSSLGAPLVITPLAPPGQIVGP
ncbi:hypothetical protein SAMN05444161_3033 [Rhizobiales bacterium GAS191]|nr:hypothetical protein SAMN05444161_3033 [Rhizobiales bacterium GAS191]